MRVDHRKISVATTLENRKTDVEPVPAPVAPAVTPPAPPVTSAPSRASTATASQVTGQSLAAAGPRQLFFEDVEVRRSRSKGISCRVTLRKGDQSYTGEAEGMENERSRLELAGRAALKAIAELDSSARVLDLGGARVVEAFDREFVFAAVTAQMVRETVLLTGTCEVKESPETASVLAVLDATNRWLLHPRRG
jgi:hypothetical protein